MRRLVVALIAVAMAFSLTGCGGGEEPAAEETTTEAEVPPPPVPTALTIDDRSAPEDATVFEEFPTGEYVPKALAAKIAAKQPTIILFVNGSQKVTNEVRAAVDTAVRANSGVVDLVFFDLGEYTSVDESGTARVDVSGIDKDAVAGQAVTMATQLKVTGLPYIIMTDDQGFIVFRHRGLVDEDLLEMHMERLTD